MRFVASLCVLALCASRQESSGQEAVPVHREPRHRLVLDSVRFRVLDVQIAPGDTTRFHVHDTAILYVDLAPSPVVLQDLGGAWPPPGPASALYPVGNVRMDSGYVLKAVTHRVTNVGNSLFRLLAITSSGPAVPGEADTTLAQPGVIELRSTWFRQSRIQVAPGSATAWSVSKHPVVIVQLSAPGVVVEYGPARHEVQGLGTWVLVPPRTRYRIANGGADPASGVAIQIR